MANHALLSASSSHRWLNCPPSARLCESYDDKGSDFAAEGTDAHALCEFKLRTALGIEAKDPTEDLTWYNSEMEECANGYHAAISMAKSMLEKGLITEEEYAEIDTILLEKYRPYLGTLLSENA